MAKVSILAIMLGSFGCPVIEAGTVNKIGADEACGLLQKNKTILHLNLRTLPENQRCRLASAQLVPFDRFIAREK